MRVINTTTTMPHLWTMDVADNVTTFTTTAEQMFRRNDSDNTEAAVSLAANFYMKMVYLSIGILGMIGNLLVIVTIVWFRRLRRRLPNLFILNQSLLDCTAGFFLIVTTGFNDIGAVNGAVGRELFCRFWLTMLPTWSLFLSSTYNLVAVTVERYVAIVHPFIHSHKFTRKRAYAVMVCVWCIGPVYNAAYMIPTAALVHDTCTVFNLWPNKTTQSAVSIITVFVQYVIPLVLIVFCYGRIASVLKSEDITSGSAGAAGGSLRNERVARGRRNVIKILAIVSACFVACWSANQIYFTMYNFGYPIDFHGCFYHFTVVCVFLNCCVNPFVYALKYDQFQVALRALFCRHGPRSIDYLSASRASVASIGAYLAGPLPGAGFTQTCDSLALVNMNGALSSLGTRSSVDIHPTETTRAAVVDSSISTGVWANDNNKT